MRKIPFINHLVKVNGISPKQVMVDGIVKKDIVDLGLVVVDNGIVMIEMIIKQEIEEEKMIEEVLIEEITI